MSMRQVPYPLIGSSNPEIVPKIDSQRTVNLYEINDPEGKEPSVLQDMPGLLQKASMGADDTVGCRGMLQHGDYLYAVYGDILYRVDNGFLVSSLGSPLTTSTGPVRFSVNENEILLVDAVKALLNNGMTIRLVQHHSNVITTCSLSMGVHHAPRLLRITGYWFSSLQLRMVWDLFV